MHKSANLHHTARIKNADDSMDGITTNEAYGTCKLEGREAVNSAILFNNQCINSISQQPHDFISGFLNNLLALVLSKP